MQLNQLQRHTPRAKSMRVGRGGKRGKTSGRGTKGQKARASGGMRPEIRDLIKKFPKRRGHGKNRARTVDDSVVKPVGVNLSVLNEKFEDGETVSPQTLAAKGVVSRRGGTFPSVKVLGTGSLTKKLTVSGCAVSGRAKELIEKAGGEVPA